MKKVFFCTVCAVLLFSCNSSKSKEEAVAPVETAVAEPVVKKEMPSEFADEKYVEIAKQELANLSAGDVDAWGNMYADNAVYLWNTGDSLAGKAAIDGYWRKRRTEVIDSISFLTPVFLPIKVNVPQQPTVAAGNWVLCWYLVDAKYKKSGKRMKQWIHTDMHFDSNDKVDRVIQYLDRSLVATAEKK